jgi:hypothetical protein
LRPFWEPVIRPLLEAVSPRVIVEVGVARGRTTVALLDFVSTHPCTLHAIDPVPSPELDLESLLERHGGRFVFHRRLSLDVLPEIAEIDAVLLDGDHNWYTVYNELKTLAAGASAAQREFPLVMMHDIDWPYGRRDLYYDPETIPPEFRHPYRRAGLVPGSKDLSEGDGINAHEFNAIVVGTPRNGVRTAVEDFLAEAGDRVEFRTIVGFHGLGILASRAEIEANSELEHRLEEFESPQWLEEHCRRLEQARVALGAQLGPLRRAVRANAANAPSGDRPAR